MSLFFKNHVKSNNNIIVPNSHFLNIFYHNCGGIRSKLNKLYVDAKSCHFNVLVFTETWLNDTFNNEEILDSNWTVFRNDRDYSSTGLSRGGGVLIASHNSLSSELIDTPTHKLFDLRIIRVSSGNNLCMYIGVIYIPPGSSESTYNELCETLSSFNSTLKEEDKVVIFGDFNRPNISFVTDENDNYLLPVNLSNAIDFTLLSTFYGSDMQQVSSVQNQNGRWLDLIFTNSYDEVKVSPCIEAENLFTNTVHHTALVVVFSVNDITFTQSYNNSITYDYLNADYESIKCYLDTLNWNYVLYNLDLDSAVSRFYQHIFTAIESYVPKIKKKNKLSEPWLDKNLRFLRNQRNKIYKLLKNTNNVSNDLKLRYDELSKEFSIKSEEAYKLYTNLIGEKIVQDPRKFFDFVNMKRKSRGYPSSMFKGNVNSSNPHEISNLYADHFQEVFCQPSNQLEVSSPISTNMVDSLNLTQEEISNAIKDLDLLKGPGPDLIPTSFLVRCSDQLLLPLYIIFNESLSCGTFPSYWKTSHLTPIYKNGDKRSIENYRGIAILSAIPKLFEKIICDKLTRVINPLLNEQQHGFRKGRSTTTNLMVMVSDVLVKMEKGHQIDAVYTDFSKAFDRVDHSILVYKLEKFGIKGSILSWLKSYLGGRSQYVKFQGTLSKKIVVSSGVPQGSHLGPLLFNIFISDLSEVLNDIPHLMYADDLKMYYAIESETDFNFLQSKLLCLEQWCIQNQLHLNVSKCNVISFSRKNQVTTHSYHLNSTELKRVNHIVDLGVVLDCKMRFNLHYDKILSRASKQLGFIKRRANEFKNIWVTTSLYCALVRPILEYACIIWSPSFGSHSERIESIQRQFLLYALRDMYNPREYCNLPPYEYRLSLLNLMPLSSRRSVLGSCFTFDVINGAIDSEFISSLISFNNPIRRSRHTRLLTEYQHHTTYANNEPINRCCREFNNISIYYSPSMSKSSFKLSLFKSLKNQN